MRTSSFWWLAAASSLALYLAIDAAVLAASRTLPCAWAGAAAFGWEAAPDLPCFMFGSHYPVVQWGVPILATLLFVSMVAAGVVVFSRSFRRTTTAVASLLEGATPPKSPKLIATARAAGRAPVLESPAAESWCFCVGWLRPTIVISSGFVQQLDLQQLRAVLTHERHHAERRDPLRLLVARTLCAIGYPIPFLRDLFASALLESELAADQAAVEAADRRALAGALRIALASPPPPRIGVAFAAGDHSLTRAACLAGHVVRTRNWRRSRLAVSAVVVLASILASLIVGSELAMQQVNAADTPAPVGTLASGGR